MVGGIGVNIKFICVNLLKKILVFPHEVDVKMHAPSSA